MSSTTGQTTGQAEQERRRGGSSSRRVFILAAIGSAVGLGSMYRTEHLTRDL